MSPDTFLEPLYRWLYSVADWLLESSTMNGWVRIFEGLRMVEGLLIVALLALGFGLGAVFVIGCYATELGRQARFLGCRERLSNARLTCGSRLPGMVGMVDAVNAEIDAADAERVEALRAADEFSRGLSALSHDVRTPLTGARGYLQLAREEADPARKDEGRAARGSRRASGCDVWAFGRALLVCSCSGPGYPTRAGARCRKTAAGASSSRPLP